MNILNCSFSAHASQWGWECCVEDSCSWVLPWALQCRVWGTLGGRKAEAKMTYVLKSLRRKG